MKSEQKLAISVPPPLNPDVDFLGKVRVPVQLTNRSRHRILVERITLQFQSNYRVPPEELQITHNCQACALEPGELAYDNVAVIPKLMFLPYTNVFDVEVTYRYETKGQVSKSNSEKRKDVSYLIIQPAPAIFGDLFISYKDPEDLELAEDLFNLAKLAGFNPYIAPNDINPGSEIWKDKIPQAIRGSKYFFVIWTSKTASGTGVQREIKICRDAAVPEVLLLEERMPPPAEYPRNKEYLRFPRQHPALQFAKALEAQRRSA